LLAADGGLAGSPDETVGGPGRQVLVLGHAAERSARGAANGLVTSDERDGAFSRLPMGVGAATCEARIRLAGAAFDSVRTIVPLLPAAPDGTWVATVRGPASLRNVLATTVEEAELAGVPAVTGSCG
jgi:hypothetical protein